MYQKTPVQIRRTASVRLINNLLHNRPQEFALNRRVVVYGIPNDMSWKKITSLTAVSLKDACVEAKNLLASGKEPVVRTVDRVNGECLWALDDTGNLCQSMRKGDKVYKPFSE